ncbi:circadian clock-controlled protein daywake [Anabrus simplex]|uniref:circadian clock-controlled protein daywake n=1 Tax=Anabrus simplex TaxID=316456 RepID=UPI0035A2A0A6
METVVVLAVIVVATAAVQQPIPDFLELCSRKDPAVDECLTSTLQRILPKFMEGVPEFDLEPFDPMVVPEMLVEYRQGDVNGKMLVKNTRVYGLEGIQVTDVRATLNDSKTFELLIDVRFPVLFLEGDYKAQGKIVVFPINGKGVYNISMIDVTATWNLTGEHVIRRRQDYVHITHFTMFPEIQDMQVYASNLFTGNEDFNKAALEFANEFWPVIYREMLPFANDAWDRILREYANRIFLKVPFKQLFP